MYQSNRIRLDNGNRTLKAKLIIWDVSHKLLSSKAFSNFQWRKTVRVTIKIQLRQATRIMSTQTS